MMDPDACLRDIRNALTLWNMTHDSDRANAVANEIAELTEALDEWLSHGGYLPAAWGPTPPCPCECNHGGFCGGCGHAGCGGRR